MKKLILLLALISLFMIGIAYATPQLTLNTVTWSAGTMVNISTKSANDDSLVNMSYITLRFSASDTANSTSKNLINITNTTATNFDLGYANFTFGNSIILEDTAVGSITGVSTGLLGGGSVALSATTVNIDRTKPTAPTTTQASESEVKDDDILTYTVTGTDTTSCRIAFLQDGASPRSSGSNTYAMTHSGNTCTYTISGIPDLNYNVYGWASDGTNSTYSSKLNLIVNSISDDSLDTGSFNVDAGQVFKGVSNNQITTIVIVVIIGLILFGKKGRRR